MLTDDQVASYREGGYLALGRLFTDEEMAELRRVTDDFVERSRDVTESNAIFDLEPGHSAERPLLRRLKDPEKQHPAYEAVLRDPGLLDALEQLIGPDVRLLSSKLNLKMPGSKTPVEWHQDWAYGAYTNDDILTGA
jgi:phytanoyl-CoA hydroxylase